MQAAVLGATGQDTFPGLHHPGRVVVLGVGGGGQLAGYGGAWRTGIRISQVSGDCEDNLSQDMVTDHLGEAYREVLHSLGP